MTLLLFKDCLQLFVLLSKSLLSHLQRLFELECHVFLELRRVHQLLLSFGSEFLLQFQFSLGRLQLIFCVVYL